MPLPPSLAGPLGRYLQSISPEALGMLMAHINRERRRGATPSEIETIIIAAARRLVREGDVQPPRPMDARRLFFSPLDPFLVDGAGLKKLRGRVERRSLTRIFRWLSRDLMSERFDKVMEQADAALEAGDRKDAEEMLAALRGEAVATIRTAIALAGSGERARLRLAGQAGGSQALDDAEDFAVIVEHEKALGLIHASLPDRIAELEGVRLERCAALITAMTEKTPAIFDHAVAMLIHRLEKPIQVLRLAKQDMVSDNATKLKASRFAVAGDLLLYDIGHAARAAAKMIDQRATPDEVWVPLFDYYTLAHGMRVETELPRADAWTDSIGRASRIVSERLGPIIASAPRLIKAALLPRGGAPIHRPDEADLAEAEYALALMQQTRTFISELALNDTLTRASNEMEHYMDMLGDFIVERLRTATPAQQDDARALLDGAVRLTRAALGEEIADYLQRSGSAVLERPAEDRAEAG